ncbi:MAG: TonB-dependent receptor, partial [Phenylobacterium sp.]|nr:TonB-dependent receptor [Phenylobacterium sp.]
MKTILLSTAALLGVLSATAAVAQPAAAPDVAGAESSNAVRGVVVTANRAPTASAEVAQAVTVLDRAQIEATSPTGLLDILASVPGVSIAR